MTLFFKMVRSHQEARLGYTQQTPAKNNPAYGGYSDILGINGRKKKEKEKKGEEGGFILSIHRYVLENELCKLALMKKTLMIWFLVSSI